MSKYQGKKGRLKAPSHYFPPELFPLVLSSACLGIVLQNCPEAKELYDEIVECYKLPGFQEILEKMNNEIPEGTELLKQIADKTKLDNEVPHNIENAGIPEMRSVMNGTLEFISSYEAEYTPWVLEGKARNRDVNLLLLKIKELIRIGFNNKKDQAKGIYKISGESSLCLPSTISMGTLYEHDKLLLKEWERLKILKIGNKIYSLADIFSDKITNRIHRNLTKQYKLAGFFLVHDQTIDNIAYHWYQCRVVYSGPEEYCREMQLKGEMLDSANISNEIKICDEILGYPRRIHKTE